MRAAAAIRSARLSAGLSQEQLARRAGLSQPVVARLERAGANPTVATLERALHAAGQELRAVPVAARTVDETQLRERLRMPPGERLRTFAASHARLNDLRGRARRAPR